MSMGAESAEAHSQDGFEAADALEQAPDAGLDHGESQAWDEPEPVKAAWGPRILAGLLWLLAAGWLAAIGWSFAQTLPSRPDLDLVLPMVVMACAPLILLSLVWLMFGRTSRRETERFTLAVAAMRGESAALESLLAAVAARLEDNHARLSNEAAKLMALGDEASDRLGRVTHYLSRESAALDRKAQALESAAGAARIDIGVMLEDLPRAEEKARSLAGALRETGLAAHEQAGSLEGQLSALIARGREADEIAGGAAQRLAAQLAQIDSGMAAAAARIDEAAIGMSAAVDSSMARASEAMDAARSGIAEQSAAALAMIEQSRAAFGEAGEDTGRRLSARLDEIGTKIQDIASHIAAQDAASQALTATLARDLHALDAQFAALGDTGRGNSEMIGNAIAGLRALIETLHAEIASGGEQAGALTERTHALSQGLAAVGEQLRSAVPEALSQVEAQAARTRDAAASIAPEVEAMRVSAEASAAALSGAEHGIGRQREAIEAMIGLIGSGVATAEDKLRALAAAIGEADEAAARIAADTGPELVEAMARVRETAAQAAERAREAIAAVIPQSTAALAEASKLAVGEAISGQVVEQMGDLALVAERAVEAARHASERLTRQMLTIGESASALEMRIDEARHEREQRDRDGFSRRVALLIESLNSTAIDVTKILSNEVTDSAWSAYLKGDRGVFTRRAVRLLDSAQAREIMAHYDAEPEFRDQVNRYIHDFESMLRRVLADREGSALGVTILSSDMGKLYVALAQAIERLRT